MAKKKKETTIINTDGIFDALFQRLSADSALPQPELTGSCVLAGIPIPSLAFQFLLGSNILPLSRMMELFGYEKSFKSTLSYEIIRWFLDAGGQAIFLETEAKDNPTVRNAILKWKKKYSDRVMVMSTSKFEKWMYALNKTIDTYVGFFTTKPKTEEDKAMGMGRKMCPVLIVIDSIIAGGTESEHEKVKDDGINAGGYGTDLAKGLSKSFRTLPDRIMRMPINLLYTNHRKEDMKQGIAYVTPGGRAPKFYASYRILCSAGKSAMDSLRPHILLEMRTIKNSLGPDKRSVSVPIIYSYETLTDGSRLLNVDFDWGTADLNFLLDYCAIKAANRKAVEAIIDINKVTVGKEYRYWSDRLNVPETDPLPSWDFGVKIMRDAELVSDLHKLFVIEQYGIYRVGDDYDEVLELTRTERNIRMDNMDMLRGQGMVEYLAVSGDKDEENYASIPEDVDEHFE